MTSTTAIVGTWVFGSSPSASVWPTTNTSNIGVTGTIIRTVGTPTTGRFQVQIPYTDKNKNVLGHQIRIQRGTGRDNDTGRIFIPFQSDDERHINLLGGFNSAFTVHPRYQPSNSPNLFLFINGSPTSTTAQSSFRGLRNLTLTITVIEITL